MQPDEIFQLQHYDGIQYQNFLSGQESSRALQIEGSFSWNGREVQQQEHQERAFNNLIAPSYPDFERCEPDRESDEKPPLITLGKRIRTYSANDETDVKKAQVTTEDSLIEHVKRGEEIPDYARDYASELTTLYIKNVEGLSEEQLCSLIQMCNNLQSISLPKNATDNSLNALMQLPNLRELDLSHCENISDEGLNIVSNLNLTYLKLEGYYNISENGFKIIGRLNKLIDLHLILCEYVTDEVLEAFLPLQDLTNLTLKGCRNITDRSLQIIGQFPNLTELNLAGCKNITNAGCSCLSLLTKLLYLDLTYCDKITNQGVLVISLIKTLQYLSLKACNLITDMCVQHIDNLPALAILNLAECENISDDARRYFAERLQLQ